MSEVKIIADSISPAGKRISTLQLKYPRFIHAQLLTHRVFSRNASSSRAVPTQRFIDQVRDEPVIPMYWGQNQAGMQAACELNPETQAEALAIWKHAASNAALSAVRLEALGVHKQTVNRLLEPFLPIHTVVTATEWDNFFTLRLHDAAQPEIQALAQAMKTALDNSTPQESVTHLPYLTDSDFAVLDSYEKQAMVSAARCARVSYLKHDGKTPDLQEDRRLAEKLRQAQHLSPFEHQAFALNCADTPCANFQGWLQFRHDFDSETSD